MSHRNTRSTGPAYEFRVRLDELQHLVDGGVWPTEALARTGWDSLYDAARAARRRGRIRLAQRLEREERIQKRFQDVA
ncbi:hypothetical protein [Brachybacterium kimchii]|uniref:Uncharacterized protein n=1 Tax=Brachybacterium kimchii TaxID=2942909 RepID=A0ABY4NB84_9MICO|nr:hypothetical protein [Brachybacterium kimchii]UQN31818.1 hypothetical protein M4486_19705 [Brachybacterium kimchii]